MADKTVVSVGLNASDGTDSSLYTTNEKPIDMHSKMFENYPSLAPLTAIFTKLSTSETHQSKVYWSEQESIPDKIVVTAAAAAAASTITSTQWAYVRRYDMFFNPATFEVLMVTAAPSSAAITVTKGWGATTDAIVDAGQVLHRIGNAYPEAHDTAYPRAVVNSEFYNYTQEIVKSTRHSTRVMNEATHFGGKGTKRTEDNRKMFYDFRKELELGVIFGTLADTLISSASGKTKTMSGILEKLNDGSNYFNVNGVLTETKIDGWLTDIYSQFPDSTNLLAVMAPKVYGTFNQIAKPGIRLSPNSKEYGMNLKQYDGAVTLDLVRHPLLVGPGLEEMMFVLDLSYMAIKYQKRPQLELDVAMKRYNYVEDKLSCFVTFMAANEARHAMAVGIKG